MADPDLSTRTGVLILRVWTEGGDPPTIRSRITQLVDTSQPEQVVTVASSADAICAAVRVWLEEFARA